MVRRTQIFDFQLKKERTKWLKSELVGGCGGRVAQGDEFAERVVGLFDWNSGIGVDDEDLSRAHTADDQVPAIDGDDSILFVEDFHSRVFHTTWMLSHSNGIPLGAHQRNHVSGLVPGMSIFLYLTPNDVGSC